MISVESKEGDKIVRDDNWYLHIGLHWVAITSLWGKWLKNVRQLTDKLIYPFIVVKENVEWGTVIAVPIVK